MIILSINNFKQFENLYLYCPLGKVEVKVLLISTSRCSMPVENLQETTSCSEEDDV